MHWQHQLWSLGFAASFCCGRSLTTVIGHSGLLLVCWNKTPVGVELGQGGFKPGWFHCLGENLYSGKLWWAVPGHGYHVVAMCVCKPKGDRAYVAWSSHCIKRHLPQREAKESSNRNLSLPPRLQGEPVTCSAQAHQQRGTSVTHPSSQLACLSLYVQACMQNVHTGKDFLSLCLCSLWLFPFHKTTVPTCPRQWYLFFKSISYFSISPLPCLTSMRWGTTLDCSCPALISGPQKALERHLTVPDEDSAEPSILLKYWTFCHTFKCLLFMTTVTWVLLRHILHLEPCIQ